MTIPNDRSSKGLLAALRDTLVNATGEDGALRLSHAATANAASPVGQAEVTAVSVGANVMPVARGADGLIYARRSGTAGASHRVTRSDDGFATREDGFNFDDVVISVTNTPTGYVAVLRTPEFGPGEVWFSEQWESGWQLVQELTPGTSVDRIGLSWHHGRVPGQHIGLIWEYSTSSPASGVAHNLWLTRDGGQTWNVILTTPLTDPTVNSHGHHAVFDPYSGRIYSSNGDGQNARFQFTEDWGNTWTLVHEFSDPDGLMVNRTNPGPHQPTLLIPCADRIVMTPDTELPPLVMSMRKDTQFKAVGEESWVLRHEHSVWNGHHTGQFFAVQPYAQEGDEIYFLYPDNRSSSARQWAFLVGSGDGGRSWHTLHAFDTAGGMLNQGIVGPDSSGQLLAYGQVDGAEVVYVITPPGWAR